MALVGDLARRLAILNPDCKNPLEGEGIVLIDEIDLHLHPKWQQLVIPGLCRIFPNCQFFISTHSPQVLTHVKAESVWVLCPVPGEGILAEQPKMTYGKTVERILEDVMGLESTRPENIQKELDAIYEAIHAKNWNHAEERIQNLFVQIGPDPDITRAKTLLARKELLGK